MDIILIIRSGKHQGAQIRVAPGQTVTVGRNESTDMTVLDDRFLSQKHFQVRVEADKLIVTDLQSTNGTKVNDQIIHEMAVEPGDIIHAGKTDFTLLPVGEENLPDDYHRPQTASVGRPIRSARQVPEGEDDADWLREEVPTREEGTTKESSTTGGFSDSALFSAFGEDQGPEPAVFSKEQAEHLELMRVDYSQSAVEPVEEEPEPQADTTTDDPLLNFFRGLNEPLYAVLDSARDPMVLPLLMQSDLEYESLYEGVKGQQLMAVAPYLVKLPKDSELLEKLCDQWGESWGIYLTSRTPFKQLRRHFRRFLVVSLEGGDRVFFRFYDPRVLRVYLPTCQPAEATQFFGSVSSYYLADENPKNLLRFAARREGAVDVLLLNSELPSQVSEST